MDLGPTDLGLADLGPTDLGPPDLGPPPRCAPRPSGDTRWPQYAMPGTAGHPRTYEVVGAAGAESVIDCVTGLEWERAASPDTTTQAEAVSRCDGLTLGGHTDWRLPSMIELVTLIDYGIAAGGPMVDTSAFPGTPASFAWSASPVAGSPLLAWGVFFEHGSVRYFEMAMNGGYSRCTR